MLCNSCGALNVSNVISCNYCRQRIEDGRENPALRILVVDDDEGIRGLLERWLSGAGLQVETAENGRDALNKYNSEEYDLGIIDVDLPFIDGITLSKTFRGRKPNFPIILCTAYLNYLSKDKISAAGADSYISKPFDLDQLLLEIQRLTFGGLEPD